MGCAIDIAASAGELRPMSYCRGMALPTHILYADDILIFCTGLKSNICCLLRIFNDYFEASGQLINYDKSKFFFGAMIASRRNLLVQMCGFTPGIIPFQYLGCPIFQGKPKCIHFRVTVDIIKVKLASCKGTLLTIMRQVQLVKSIVHGMLVYSIHIYRWPINLLNQLDQWVKNSVWSGDIFSRKICMVAWRTVCLSGRRGA